MKVNVKSVKETDEKIAKLGYKPDEPPFVVPQLPNDGWTKTGTNITYKLSKLSQTRMFSSATCKLPDD